MSKVPSYIRSSASTLPLAGMAAGQAAGLPVMDVMMPNVFQSAFTGVITAAPFVHKGGMHFNGLLGYKTFFTGTTGLASKISIGNAVLGAVETGGNILWKRGIRSEATAWATRARTLGLTGLSSAKDFSSKKEAAAYISALRRGSKTAETSTWMRFAGGQSDDAERIIMRRIARDEGKDVFRVMTRNKMSNFLIKGRAMAALGTGLSVLSWMQVAAPVVGWMSDRLIDSVGSSLGALRQLTAERKFHMGTGYLSDSFSTRQAATERQRAVQAIYASKVNPSNLMYGNEGAMYHR